jgi:VWFA-related protein
MRARAVFLIALFAGTVGAQEPAPQQPPSAPPPQQPQQQQQPPPPTFRSGTNLVRVDVTVTDKRGEPVRTLTPDDFEVTEDGTPQQITSFKLLEATGQPTDDLSLPIRSPEHAAAEAARDDVRVFLIFWDEYHIGEFVPSLRAREQLTKFVLQAFGPTDLVAFMDPLTTLDSIRFTRDRRVLAEHVQRLRGRRGVYMPPRSVMEESHLQMRDVEGIRAQITTGALKGALLHLGSIREGRKSLILISETLGPLRDQTFKITADLMRTANDTNTAIVVVDPRGLQVGRAGRPSDILLSLSYGSGGEPIVTNDLVGPLRRIVRQASAYYLLGYSAANSPLDGKFHEIKVRVKKGGMDVRARSGYWAPRATEVARARAAAAAAEPPPAVAKALAEMPRDASRRPAQFWVGTMPKPGAGGEVTIAWKAGGAIGDRAAASVDVVATGENEQVHAGPVEPGGLTFTAPAGRLVLTFSIRDAAGDIIDREERTVMIPRRAATLALSTPAVFRARTPLELRALNETPAPPVYAGRDFERSDRLRVKVTVYGSESEGSVVSARLLGTRGSALADLPVESAGTPGVYQIDLMPSSISRGEFVIAIQAEKGTERVEAMVPFRVR